MAIPLLAPQAALADPDDHWDHWDRWHRRPVEVVRVDRPVVRPLFGINIGWAPSPEREEWIREDERRRWWYRYHRFDREPEKVIIIQRDDD